MNAYLHRRLVDPVIVAAGMSDQCAFGSGHDPTIGICSQLAEIRNGI